MIPRYTRPQMAAIWAPENRFRIWFEIEAHACEAMAGLGILPREAAKAIWDGGAKAMAALKADPAGNVEKIDAIERAQAVIEFDLSGRAVAANSLFLNMKGYDADSLKNLHHRDLCEPSFAASDEHSAFWERLIAGEFARCFVQPAETFVQGLLAVHFAWLLDGCDSIGRPDQVLGPLFERFLRLKDKLEKEGLFDPAAKRPVPAYPRRIGVVTSLAAAALRDVLTTLRRRNPSIPVVVYPAPVQGEGAAAKLAQAIATAGRRSECDVLLLVRGGGSIEDLWSFNEEVLARAIRDCGIPVISGVGHETDFTIADFAADERAPTPTAAAERASPLREALLARVAEDAARLDRKSTRLNPVTATSRMPSSA